VTRLPLPTRTLPERPDFDQIKRQAKELLQAFRRGEAAAVAEVNAQYHGADPDTFALHDAQLVVARAHGFESWPKLKAFVDGATVKRLIDAVRSRNMDAVRTLLHARPELARMSHANLQVLHHAVLENAPDMVRILMAHDANAREGVYPHREATTAYAIAVQRGCDDIVRIIEEEEQKRRDMRSGMRGAPPTEALFRLIQSGDADRVIATLDEDPAVVHTRHATIDVSPLHVAARALDARIVSALLDRGADPAARGHHDFTPLDAAAHSWYRVDAQRFADVAALLLKHGAPMTASAAAALGNIDWLRARHAAGALSNPIEDTGGLIRIAAAHNRADVLELLLDCGFDPDERMRFGEGDDSGVSWGMALQHCVSAGKYEMAEMLLQRGADPNALIYASGDPVFSAYAHKDWKMLALLERHGGVPTATTAGLFRQTDLARKMLAGEARYRMDGVGGDTVAEQLLWGATCGGDPEIVRMALQSVDWPRDDPRWFAVLEQPLRMWTHGPSGDDLPRDTYLTCFGLVIERCGSEPARPPDGRTAVWIDDASQHRRARRHDTGGARRLRGRNPGPRRPPRHSGQLVEEHAARMGLPLGTVAARQAVARQRRRSDRSRRGAVGDADRLGQQEWPQTHRSLSAAGGGLIQRLVARRTWHVARGTWHVARVPIGYSARSATTGSTFNAPRDGT
jgi:ankyrin repeat protein